MSTTRESNYKVFCAFYGLWVALVRAVPYEQDILEFFAFFQDLQFQVF